MNTQLRWVPLLLLAVALFFWKIVFTQQFSVFLNYDNANQAYAWDHFSAVQLRHGVLPLWDPYVQAGRSFIGEMQTALFYPLKLVLYFSPFNRRGLLPLRVLHVFFVFAHVLGAWFMFLLGRELALSDFAAFTAAVCFSLGGFVGRVGWPNMLDSGIWLPLIFLFLLRGLGAQALRASITWAALAGLGLGMAILAGSLHVAMMQAVAVAAAALYGGVAIPPGGSAGPEIAGGGFRRGFLVAAVVAVVAFAAGAVQLLPSMEYSRFAIRNRGIGLPALPALETVPYSDLTAGPDQGGSYQETFLPHSYQAFLLGSTSAGAIAFSPYFGVLPFLLAIVGVWQSWERPWVRYLAALAVLAFLYTLGPFSLLHGLLYALVPYFWIAPEAGRFIYLTHFAGAILAGFGAEKLFSGSFDRDSAVSLVRVMKWAVIVTAAVLVIPLSGIGKPQGDEWVHFSFLLLIGSCGMLAFVTGGHRGPAARVALTALILFDLHAFNWTIANKNEAYKSGQNHLETLLRAGDLASFLKSQPGLFRVHMAGEWRPNIGDLYGIQTINGIFATRLQYFTPEFWKIPRAADLLNVRFFVTSAAPKDNLPGATAIYNDGDWKVYENDRACPRAWLVHEAVTEPSWERTLGRMKDTGFDPLRTALVAEALDRKLPPESAAPAEAVVFDSYAANQMELRVHASASALLVLSEVYYPGWQATVDGRPAHIYRTDLLLRGVLVPAGESRVTLRYTPATVIAGAALTLMGLAATLCLAILELRGRLPSRPSG